MDRKTALLQIWAAKGIGMKRMDRVMEICGEDPSMIFRQGPDYVAEHTGLSTDVVGEIFSDASRDSAETIRSQIDRYNIKMMVKNDVDYPSSLNDLDNPPSILFAEGCVSHFPKKMLAIVGSRTPSAESVAIAQRFSAFLSQNRIGVVSGFARGIDHAAHQTAMQTGSGWTAAILGSGLRTLYPAEYSGFAQKLKQTGVLLSEFGLFENAKPQYFPLRNRLIAGLSDAVLVIEASEKSGSLITADHALKLGKEVFVIPMNPRRSTEGSNRLIKDGAVCVTQPEEIFQHLRWEYDSPADKADFCDNPILSLFSENAVLSAEEILNEVRMGVSDLISVLGRMEAEGLIIAHPGQRWSLNYAEVVKS